MNESRGGNGEPRETDELGRLVQALAGEKAPPAEAEDQVVNRLTASGALNRPLRGPKRAHTKQWAVGAVAAVALFMVGFVTGQVTKPTGGIDWGGAAAGSSGSPADVIVRASAEYLAALSSIKLPPERDLTGQTRIRGALRQSLSAAAREMLRVDPLDPLGSEIVRGFRRVQLSSDELSVTDRNILWY